jgi:hypothetical protein
VDESKVREWLEEQGYQLWSSTSGGYTVARDSRVIYPKPNPIGLSTGTSLEEVAREMPKLDAGLAPLPGEEAAKRPQTPSD